ncbi:MAG TPA: TonB-dependent receptor plug domain-containing protein, partial [Methylophilaceae bacterium]|nr:TonB-dependent receptor plug domain-containing protein [Methylophilaceae bacterium]
MIKKTKVFVAVLASLPMTLLADQLSEERDLEIGPVTVTATREAQKVSETPSTVNIINQETVQELRPAHPSEIMRKVPGVTVTVTNGEGHQTSIRQPITTAPVYLYLEDGIPTRSTGFFNHNALFEIN